MSSNYIRETIGEEFFTGQILMVKPIDEKRANLLVKKDDGTFAKVQTWTDSEEIRDEARAALFVRHERVTNMSNGKTYTNAQVEMLEYV